MVDVFDSDYVKLAESKGMYGRSLVMKHVLRNALIPIVTVLAPLIVDLLTGALVVEKIYGINGIGKLMVDAIAGEGLTTTMCWRWASCIPPCISASCWRLICSTACWIPGSVCPPRRKEA